MSQKLDIPIFVKDFEIINVDFKSFKIFCVDSKYDFSI